MLEILSIPLLGVIPESREVLHTSNKGEPITIGSPDSAPAGAYFDAAAKLNGNPKVMAAHLPAKPNLFSEWFTRKAA